MFIRLDIHKDFPEQIRAYPKTTWDTAYAYAHAQYLPYLSFVINKHTVLNFSEDELSGLQIVLFTPFSSLSLLCFPFFP